MRGRQHADADDDPYRQDFDGEDLEGEEGDDEGAELEDAEPDAIETSAPRLVCADCGAKNDADALFCTKCAARLHEAEAPEEDVIKPDKAPRYVE